eukprot:scaffold2146_cov425-Prasinococcus_capsulatus_cf.AAC.6
MPPPLGSTLRAGAEGPRGLRVGGCGLAGARCWGAGGQVLARVPLRAHHGGGAGEAAAAVRRAHAHAAPARAGRALRRARAPRRRGRRAPRRQPRPRHRARYARPASRRRPATRVNGASASASGWQWARAGDGWPCGRGRRGRRR